MPGTQNAGDFNRATGQPPTCYDVLGVDGLGETRMRALLRTGLAILLLLGGAAPGEAAGHPGVVLLHGKTGMPDQLAKLAAALKADGYAVATPEMCWSKQRIFDKALPDCLAEVDTAVAGLKSAGSTEVVVGGTSQGAVAALDYGASHAGLAGIIAMAPAADPNDAAAYPKFAAAIAQARALVQAGKGDSAASFADLISGGNTIAVRATPKAYLSFHDSDAPVATIRNLTRSVLPQLRVPVLWVAGTKDPAEKGAQNAFASIPKQASNRYVTVEADHAGTPDASAAVVADWLKSLP